MRLPLVVLRWFHRRHISRPRLKGSRLHRWLGDRLLDKALWRATPEGLARSWLVGSVVTSIPFLPFQTLIAGAISFAVRGNILLSVGLQYLSNPVTAIFHLPACYFAGKLLFGHSPAAAWREAAERDWSQVLRHPSIIAHEVIPLYLGGVVLGLLLGLIGYVIILAFGHRWQAKHPRSPANKAAPRISN